MKAPSDTNFLPEDRYPSITSVTDATSKPSLLSGSKEINITKTHPDFHIQMKAHITERTYEDPTNCLNNLYITDVTKTYELVENIPSRSNINGVTNSTVPG